MSVFDVLDTGEYGNLELNGNPAPEYRLLQVNFGNSYNSVSTIGTGTEGSMYMRPQNDNVFQAPTPSEEITVGSSHPAAPEGSKDYHCVAECLRNGGQYQLCTDRCTRSTCPVGSTECKDLRGITHDQALPGLPPMQQQAAPAAIGTSYLPR